MDPLRFDALTRRLAHGTSRRQVLKQAVVAVAGVLAVGRQATAGAAGCKADGKACSKNDQCCSDNCIPVPLGHVAVAQSGSICCAAGQVQTSSGTCCTPEAKATTCAGQCGTVTDNCGQTVDCGGSVGCPCTPDLSSFPGATQMMPIGPGDGCDTGLVCDCGQTQGIGVIPSTGQDGVYTICQRPAVCRENHVSLALGVDIKGGSNLNDSGHEVELLSFDPDSEYIVSFRIKTFPQNGVLDPVDAPYPIQGVDWPQKASAVPWPPLPEGVPTDCFPNCLFTQTCSGNESTIFDTSHCPGCVGDDLFLVCPQGHIISQPTAYTPFSSNFTGTDSFTYVAVDAFGVEGPPALVTITVFEV